MNTLQVTCKSRNRDRVEEVAIIDFFNEEVELYPYAKWQFIDIEWIDFGTTRWFPNSK